MQSHKEKPEIPAWVHIGCKVIWKGYEWTVTDIGELSRTVELNGDQRLRASVREIQRTGVEGL